MRGTVPVVPSEAPTQHPPLENTAAITNARWYFAGLAGSLIGNSAMSLVAGIWVKVLTGSSAQAGLISACIYAGTMGAPIAGLIADCQPRRRLLFVLNLASAVTILPLVLVSSSSRVWVVFVVMAIYGIEATLMDPAEDALFAQMLSADFRQRVNGWRLAIQESGRLAAPLLGAGLFELLSGGAVAALDAGTFVFAAFAITRLRVDDVRPAITPEPLLGALLAGTRHVLRASAIRPIAIAATLVMAVSGVGVAAQYSLVHGIRERPAFLGILTALLGAGSVIASLTASRIIRSRGERTLACLGLVNFAAGNLLRANHWLPAVLTGSALLGFALPYVFLAALNAAQRATPNALQGRVSAALSLALFGPQALTQTIGSGLISVASYRAIYAGSAIASLLIAIWLCGAARGAPHGPH